MPTMQSPITQLDALDLAAAALRDCRKAALAAAEPRYASLLFEAHDHIQHLREQYKGNARAEIVPRETNLAPVLTMDQVATLNPA
jgi:hypothetical protein